jgi:hypothetical protein
MLGRKLKLSCCRWGRRVKSRYEMCSRRPAHNYASLNNCFGRRLREPEPARVRSELNNTVPTGEDFPKTRAKIMAAMDEEIGRWAK